MAGIRYTKAMPYAAGLALALTLGACSGGGETPPATTTVTTSSTTTSAPKTTAPTTSVDPVLARIPAAARPETPEGALAFAAFFMDSLNAASKSAEPDLLDGLFTSECITCVAMSDSIASLERQGRRHSGNTIKVLQTDPVVFTSTRRIVRIKVDQLAVDVVDAQGRKVERTLAGEGAFAMTLAFSNGHWTATKLQTISS